MSYSSPSLLRMQVVRELARMSIWEDAETKDRALERIQRVADDEIRARLKLQPEVVPIEALAPDNQ